MSKHKDPLLEALKEGKSYTWIVPDGGDLASMREAIKHGQTLTMSPIGHPGEIQVGDLVLVKWHQGNIFHLGSTEKLLFGFAKLLVRDDGVIPTWQNTVWFEIDKCLVLVGNVLASFILFSIQISSTV